VTQLLLARFAQELFWLARYLERAESLARILDVQETFTRDRAGAKNWRSVVQINADEARFYAAYAEATPHNVVQFFVLDADNPTSIRSAVRAARANARALRPLVSTESWMHLNVFNAWLGRLGPEDIALPNLSRLCARIKESCQTQYGISEGTYFRDQGWLFYRLGKSIERADQTTRLLDVKYNQLLTTEEQAGSPVDDSQWNALLRSVAAYHAFRRVHPSGLSPELVVGFLLFNRAFPRSVLAATQDVHTLLNRLYSGFDLRQGAAALEHLDELLATLADHSAERVVARGLHEFNDWLQRQLIDLTSEIGRAYFGLAPAAAPASAGEPVSDQAQNA